MIATIARRAAAALPNLTGLGNYSQAAWQLAGSMKTAI